MNTSATRCRCTLCEFSRASGCDTLRHDIGLLILHSCDFRAVHAAWCRGGDLVSFISSTSFTLSARLAADSAMHVSHSSWEWSSSTSVTWTM